MESSLPLNITNIPRKSIGEFEGTMWQSFLLCIYSFITQCGPLFHFEFTTFVNILNYCIQYDKTIANRTMTVK